MAHADSSRLSRILHDERSPGIVMLAMAVLAMAIKNSSAADYYTQLLMLEGQVRVGALNIEKPMVLWINDGLMAIFFFMVGLEIKREVLFGNLAEPSQRVLPAIGAIGGVVVPALLYLSLTWDNPTQRIGWAVPTATDIAFALTVLALLGKGVPASLKVFLMTLAILDDLIAIVIIAFFYTSSLSANSLIAASGFLAILFTLNRAGVSSTSPYLVAGLGLWVCVLKSGVHATLAGVIVALFIPTHPSSTSNRTMLDEIITALHAWVAFGILPIFAFANAGIQLAGLSFGMVADPVPLGITLGLLLGKPIGVVGAVFIAVKCGLAKLPQGVCWQHIVGVGFLCGIGFTMSLFVGGLAFAEGGSGYARIDRLGILLGSTLSAVIGYLILKSSLSASHRSTP